MCEHHEEGETNEQLDIRTMGGGRRVEVARAFHTRRNFVVKLFDRVNARPVELDRRITKKFAIENVDEILRVAERKRTSVRRCEVFVAPIIDSFVRRESRADLEENRHGQTGDPEQMQRGQPAEPENRRRAAETLFNAAKKTLRFEHVTVIAQICRRGETSSNEICFSSYTDKNRKETNRDRSA